MIMPLVLVELARRFSVFRNFRLFEAPCCHKKNDYLPLEFYNIEKSGKYSTRKIDIKILGIFLTENNNLLFLGEH